MRRLAVHIDGMSCSHCLNAVNQALHQVPGLEVESVVLGRAEVVLRDPSLTADRVITAIEAAGYPAIAASAE